MLRYDLGSVSNFRLFGFATWGGDYTCKCAECGMDFIGDKRSYQCLGCAIQHTKKTSHNSDYTKCSNELLDYITDNICDNGVSKKEIKAILKKHFA